jgi:hypothetical protein
MTASKPPAYRVSESAGAILQAGTQAGDACPATPRAPLQEPDTLHIDATAPIDDFDGALAIADSQAGARLGDYMLLSWYDRDRDYESPRNASECHEDSAVPGYVDFGVSHGANLKIDVEQGRFVFYYLGL